PNSPPLPHRSNASPCSACGPFCPSYNPSSVGHLNVHPAHCQQELLQLVAAALGADEGTWNSVPRGTPSLSLGHHRPRLLYLLTQWQGAASGRWRCPCLG